MEDQRVLIRAPAVVHAPRVEQYQYLDYCGVLGDRLDALEDFVREARAEKDLRKWQQTSMLEGLSHIGKRIEDLAGSQSQLEQCAEEREKRFAPRDQVAYLERLVADFTLSRAHISGLREQMMSLEKSFEELSKNRSSTAEVSGKFNIVDLELSTSGLRERVGGLEILVLDVVKKLSHLENLHVDGSHVENWHVDGANKKHCALRPAWLGGCIPTRHESVEQGNFLEEHVGSVEHNSMQAGQRPQLQTFSASFAFLNEAFGPKYRDHSREIMPELPGDDA